MENKIIEALNWRYDTKRMTGAKIPDEQLQNIMEAIRLSPSAYGLQPYSVVVIENIELMKKIQPIANLQTEITEASVLLVIAAWDKVTQERVDEYVHHISEVRDVAESTLTDLKQKMELRLNNTPGENFHWASMQAYIALGMGMAAAAMEKIDSTPIDRFNSEDLDEVLQLKEMGLKSILLLALGYRDTERDATVTAKKVRRESKDMFITLQSSIGFNATHINSRPGEELPPVE